jgi:acyl-coenzyme A synthetase/AMP-(fatty) acid ligase
MFAPAWLRTGDVYRRDGDGYLWHVGRSDDLFKANGQWVSPVEVEAALCAHASVLEAAVVGERDASALVHPRAFVALRPGAAASPALADELRAFARGRLAPHKAPREILFVAELPKTATGKVQRHRLREAQP